MDEQVEIEWVVLADYAETVNNKLYLMGGGWEGLTVNTGFPLRHNFAIAVAVTVPWNLTNRPHAIEVTITDQDELRLFAKIAGQLEVGRPVGILPGQPQRVQMAVKIAMDIAEPGTYVITARVEGQENPRRVRFNVLPGPNVRMVTAQEEQ